MKASIKAALLTIGLIGGTMAIGQPALADNVTVGIGGGGIAFGYNDGYWDRGHTWHTWRDQAEADQWRAANHDHYYDYKHDRDASQGWHDERWWDRH